MSNPYESPKTNDDVSPRRAWPVYLAGLILGGMFLLASLTYLILSKPAPNVMVTPMVAPIQQPVQAEQED